MRKVGVLNSVSLDGYFTDADNDYSWTHEGADDPEMRELTKNNAKGQNALVCGCVTYELMAAWWADARSGKGDARSGQGSRSLDRVEWQNTTLLKGDPAKEIARIKETPGPDTFVLTLRRACPSSRSAPRVDFACLRSTHG